METVSHLLMRQAQQLAQLAGAKAILVYVDAVSQDDHLCHLIREVDFPTILVARSKETRPPPGLEDHTCIMVPSVHLSRGAQVKAALLTCLARGLLHNGDWVVCLIGVDGSGTLDSLLVRHLGSEQELVPLLDVAFGSDFAPEVFERILTLATQLAVEGREGRPVGTLFVLGDSEHVLAQSRNLVLNPFRGHPEAERNILEASLAETIKEFSALDGAFVVRGDGTVLTAGTNLLPTGPYVRLPGGLGTRHAAAAGITASTAAVAVCVSQSTGTVTIFRSGRLVTAIPRASNSGDFSM